MSAKIREQYKLKVEQDVVETMSSSSGILNKPNSIASLQKMYQRAPQLPIHLRGKGDARLTGSLMLASYGGIAVAVGTVLLMAYGGFKKS